ncbi:ribonuclease P protein component 4 [Bacteroidota bacterium]
MAAKHSRKPSEQTETARKHVDELFAQADAIFDKDSALADRYVDLARKTAMKFKLKLKSEYRRKFCKHCYKYLRAGVNCRVRTQFGKLVYSCFSCKKFTRFTL